MSLGRVDDSSKNRECIPSDRSYSFCVFTYSGGDVDVEVQLDDDDVEVQLDDVDIVI